MDDPTDVFPRRVRPRRRTPATLRHLPLSPTSAIPDLYPLTVAVTLTVNLGLNFLPQP